MWVRVIIRAVERERRPAHGRRGGLRVRVRVSVSVRVRVSLRAAEEENNGQVG